jgi:Leucine-rich repeat (LRR) protein
VADLLPLNGMPLKVLACDRTHVTDLSPLEGMSLTELYVTPQEVTKGIDVIRRMMSLQTINRLKPAEFWKKYDAGEFGKPGAAAKSTLDDPAFQKWMKSVAVLSAEEQVKAVVKKLQELNPGYDGAVQGWNGVGNLKIENGVVTEFGVFNSPVADISPVRALIGLKVFSGQAPKVNDLAPLSGLPLIDLNVVGSAVTDLSPLKGMKLAALECDSTGVADLAPLKGMPLKVLLLGGTKISDLTQLTGMPLETLNLGNAALVADLSPLKGMKLKTLYCNKNKVSDLSPLAGMPLETLFVSETPVFDLTPLQGMSLKEFHFTPANITKGIEVIRQMKSLERISNTWNRNPMSPAEFWKKYDAGEFGKPPAAASQKEIDLLRLVDPKKDAVIGTWSIEHGELVCASDQWGLIELFYEPPEEYDFVIEFTRKAGHDALSQICYAKGHRFDWAMGAWAGTVSGLGAIDGKTCKDNPTRSTVGMELDHRYTSIVKVRKDGIDVMLDGHHVAYWKTDYHDMTLFDKVSKSLRRPNTLALTAYESPTVFHSVKIIEVTGQGRPVEGP